MTKATIKSYLIEDQEDAEKHIGKRVGAARVKGDNSFIHYKVEHPRDDIKIRQNTNDIRRRKPKPEGPGVPDAGKIKREHVFGIVPEGVDPFDLPTTPDGFSRSDVKLSNVAADMSFIEFDNAVFLFHLLTWPGYRGEGYGKVFIDILVAYAKELDVKYISGFVGNGDTKNFLKKQGFSGAKFELWTDADWGDDTYSNEYWAYSGGKKPKLEVRQLDKEYESYWNLPEEIRKQYKPNTQDLADKYGEDAIQGNPGKGALKVRKYAAEGFWESGWNIYFLDQTSNVLAERSGLYPLTDRRAPIANKLKRLRNS